MLRKVFSKINNPLLRLLLKRMYCNVLSFFKAIIYLPFYGRFLRQFKDIIACSEFDLVDVFIYRFGWHTELYQRPQHICESFSKQGVLVFYAKNFSKDDVRPFIEKVFDRLYLIDIDNPVLTHALFKALRGTSAKKIIHTCSTELLTTVRRVKKYKRMGFSVLYEYIDEISEDLTSTKIPKSHYKKHEYLLRDKDAYIVSSAKILQSNVTKLRGESGHILATNGVNCNHWQGLEKITEPPEDLKRIVDYGKPIIAYFGALAKWFDYELLKKISRERPGINILLLGWEYDKSFDESGIANLENVYYLGCKPYTMLKNYIRFVDVCMIPFLINDITVATSPVKLFEYMAAGKPCVCTAMPECKGYDAVCIADNHEEFLEKIDYCIANGRNADFIEALKRVAQENTWDQKAEDIINLLKGKVL